MTFWLLRWLPDRGYGLTKLLGALGITYVVWLLGSTISIAASPVLPVASLIAFGGVGWWLLGEETLTALRSLARVALIEEVIFVVGFTYRTSENSEARDVNKIKKKNETN